MDTVSCIFHIKSEDIYSDIAVDVEKRSDPCNYKVNRPLPMGKNKKVIGLMKDGLGGIIMKKFVALKLEILQRMDVFRKKQRVEMSV